METRSKKGKLRTITVQEFKVEAIIGEDDTVFLVRHNDMWPNGKGPGFGADEYYVLRRGYSLQLSGPYSKGEILDDMGIVPTI